MMQLQETFKALEMKGEELVLIDQRLLPTCEQDFICRSSEDVFHAPISWMHVPRRSTWNGRSDAFQQWPRLHRWTLMRYVVKPTASWRRTSR